MAKFHAALKPGGVWAFNTYSRNSSVGARCSAGTGTSWWPTPVRSTTTRRCADCIDEAGFDLVARRRDRPYASVERLLFVLLSHAPHGVRDAFFKRIHFLNRWVVPMRAPDAFEYVCVKR